MTPVTTTKAAATAAAAARDAARNKATGEFGEQPKLHPGELDLGTDIGIATHYSALDRDQRLDAIKADLTTAIDGIVQSGRLAEWLDRLALKSSVNGMNRWSFRNRLLADLQTENRRAELTAEELEGMPAGPMVMTAKSWMDKFNRHPKRGSSAIWIMAPSKRWVEEEDPEHPGKTRRKPIVIGFREQSEFDVSQTEGDPLPDFDPPIEFAAGHIEADVMPHLTAQVTASGYSYSEEKIDSHLTTAGTQGYTTTDGSKRVVVDSRLPAAQKALTVAHELAHIKCGHVDGGQAEYRAHRGQMETEAEMASYMVACEMGLPRTDSQTFSAFYIASWSKGDPAVVEKAFGKASAAALKISDGFRNN